MDLVAVASAAAGLASKLLEIGVDQWRKKEEGRRCMSGILSAVRVELVVNWMAVDRGDPDNGAIELSSAVWTASGAALSAAMADRQIVLGRLQTAYVRCSGPVRARADQKDALIDIGRAIAGVDQLREREDLERLAPQPWECERPRSLGELLVGMPMDTMIAIHIIWKRWEEAVRTGSYRPYRFAEVDAKRMRRDPYEEAEFRRKAALEYSDNHCYELEPGIFEFWVDDETRILFTIEDDKPFPLDLVRLVGPDAEGWTPGRLLVVARCRQYAN